MTAVKEELAKCSGCSVLGTYLTDSSIGLDPTRESSIVNSLVLKYGSNLQYMLTSYGFGLQAVVQATSSAGSKVKIGTHAGDPPTLALIKQGLAWEDANGDPTWSAYATVDQLIRVFDGAPALSDSQMGVPVHVFTASDPQPNDTWVPPINFTAMYLKLWGVA
jgi:ribose transport system substrate-binding protein